MLLVGASVLALAFASMGLATPSGEEQGANAKRGLNCGDALDKLAKAKKRLKELKQDGASSQAIRKAKQKVRKAKEAVKKACGEQRVVYDITAMNASFDATVIGEDQSGPCTPVKKDAHWTGVLAPGAKETASLTVYYRDNQGRPIYIFSHDSGGGVPMVVTGNGIATRTCRQPEPGINGTVTCTFAVEQTLGAAIYSDGEASDPKTMELNWFFGFNSFSYGNPRFGGSCSQSDGPNPPADVSSAISPGLFVSPQNKGLATALEPVGISSVPTSTFDQAVTLSFSGSGAAAFGGSLESKWDMTVTLRRR